MRKVLYIVHKEIKVGDEDWKIFENRYRANYGSVISDKRFTEKTTYSSFEEMWEVAGWISGMVRCQNRFTKARSVKFESASNYIPAVEISEKSFKPVSFRYVFKELSKNNTIKMLAEQLSYKEFIDFIKDNGLTP